MAEVLTNSSLWDDCPHGLTKGTCSICRAPRREPLDIESTTIAQYEGRCANVRSHDIDIGDKIGYVEGLGWVCEDCCD